MAVEEKGPVPKIEFEQAKDFKFKAAYEAYSKCFDQVRTDDDRNALNEKITKLFNNEMSYPNFYGEINQLVEGKGEGHEFHRVRIEGQRKRDYRRDEQKTDRIKRHKK